MIELKLIGDGTAKVPYEATDDSVLQGLLKAASNIPDDAQAPISGWRDIERRIPGTRDYVAIRVPGEPADYPGNSLNGIQNAIIGNISGLKAHPQGWQYVEP